MRKPVRAVLFVVLAYGCGESVVEPPPNRAPVAAGAVAPLTLTAGAEQQVNIAPLFSDPDGDALIYTASVADATVADVAMSGNTATVVGRAAGSSTLTLTATDPGGLAASQTASVTVRWPSVTGTWEAASVVENQQWRWRFNLNQTGRDLGGAWTLEVVGFSGAIAGAFISGAVDYPVVTLQSARVPLGQGDHLQFSYRGQLPEGDSDRILGTLEFAAGLVVNVDLQRVR